MSDSCEECNCCCQCNSEEEDNGPVEEDLNSDNDVEIEIEISSEEEPEQIVIVKNDPISDKFKPANPAERRLLNDLRAIMKSNSHDNGFSAEPDHDSLNIWNIKLFGFDKKDAIYEDIQKYKSLTGRDYVELKAMFPPDYPVNPPFITVVRPRFIFHTGRVTVGGSICTDILTQAGWKPTYNIEALLANVFAEILSSHPRIDLNNSTPYSLEEAKSAFMRVAADHGWKISNWLPK